MTVAFDASSTSTQWRDNSTYGTANPATWTHTPVGTPKGVIVLISQVAISGTDCITSVTYGGVSMTRVANGFAQDVATEVGAAYAYFLGSGIPTGAQTVSVSYDDNEESMKRGVCITLTASANTTVVASGKVEGDAANPAISLAAGAATAFRAGVLYSGQDAIASVTDAGGQTRILGEKLAEGPYCRVYSYQTTPASGTSSISWTALSDDVAAVAVAVAEVAAATSADAGSASGTLAAGAAKPGVSVNAPVAAMTLAAGAPSVSQRAVYAGVATITMSAASFDHSEMDLDAPVAAIVALAITPGTESDNPSGPPVAVYAGTAAIFLRAFGRFPTLPVSSTPRIPPTAPIRAGTPGRIGRGSIRTP